jgi:hypothetical protein
MTDQPFYAPNRKVPPRQPRAGEHLWTVEKTQADALWYALGANKANGQRLTPADKKHAVLLTFRAWPEMSAGKIAEQVGCSQDYVSQLRSQVKDSFDPARPSDR